jgi:hypothetical protein
MGGVGDALADLVGELFDRALPLGQDVYQLRPAAAGHCLGDLGECIEHGVLGDSLTHIAKYNPDSQVIK